MGPSTGLVLQGRVDARVDRLIVRIQPCGDASQGLQHPGGRAREPRIERRRLPRADQGGKVLRQVDGGGDLGRRHVELGERLGLSSRACRLTPPDKPGGAAWCQRRARGRSHPW